MGKIILELEEDRLTETVGYIIDCFEALLDDKGIVLENPDRDSDEDLDPEEAANIFGDDYYRLEDEIKEILYGKVKPIHKDRPYVFDASECRIDEIYEKIWDLYLPEGAAECSMSMSELLNRIEITNASLGDIERLAESLRLASGTLSQYLMSKR